MPSGATTPAQPRLAVGARALIAGVATGAAASIVASALWSSQPGFDMALLAVLILACAAGNLFEVFAPGHFSLQPNLVPFVWGAAVLPAWAIPILAVASFLPGWLIRRPPWYMPLFNVANYALVGVLVYLAAEFGGAFEGGGSDILSAVALMAGAAALVFLNHALIGAVVDLADERPWRRVLRDALSLRATAGGRLIDLALATTGACLAVLWAEAPGYAPLAAGPVLLIGLAVWVPMLRHESRVDAKTGLFNAGHLLHVLESQVELAQRRGSTLGVLMVDLDHMRAINNRFGHLEGDRLIRGVAEVLKRTADDAGAVASRFGGEEFCLLLPGATSALARTVAESVCSGVREVRVGNGIAASASVGVAMFPDHGGSAEDLMHAADLALYDAKLGGRGRVRVALSASTRAMLGLQEDAAASVSESPAREIGGELQAVAVAESPTWRMTVEGADPAHRSAAGPPMPSEPAPEREPEPVAEEPADVPSRRWLWPYAGVLGGLAVLLAVFVGLSGASSLTERWELLAMLVGMVVLLDLVRLDLFERVQISPASMPALALAASFGPLGPIVAEALIAILRAVRRVPPVKFTFDFGALSLAGGAAAAVFTLGSDSAATMIGVGVLAGLAYYAVNIPLLAIVIAFARGSSPLANWREQLSWLAPHYVAYGLLAAVFVLAERRLGLSVGLIFTVPVIVLWVAERQYVERSRAGVSALRAKNIDLEQANVRLRSLLADNDDLLHRIHHSYLSTITSLARTIEARDPYTGGHTERVGELARRLAVELGFGEADLRAIEVGAVMHDIGKIGIPDRILLKEGPLTPEERQEMQRHPEISSYILGELEMPSLVKQMARSHHERYDGGGYPDGLVGEEIPLPARILTVADTLDAITSDRPYRPARTVAVALEIIEAGAGTQFCPRVVAVLRALLEREPELGAAEVPGASPTTA